ncbi:MAG: M56 family metallopeptidase [Lutibacter sp.]|uniref:M56 family metallopeptidase n=1 Tax=Lutibacter sp. TaxID=1925666 RepID=UPI00299DC238|nr:M56 family metallopeptidase [Lutibacter sp.]MDX1830277.1 M56 family metallopeptidase [Lutibacter sp.]
MDYLLKANGLVFLLFSFYHLVLKNETFFKWNRTYFLIGVLLIITLPLAKIPIYVEATVNDFSNLNYQEIASTSVEKTPFDWVNLLSYIYIIGIVIFATKFLIQLISLGIFLKKLNFEKIDNFYYAETDKNTSPFSFFNYIVYNPNLFSKKELHQIINHEKAHAIQQHSLDNIISNLMTILFWFNPFAWLLKKSIQQNLEFLADNYAQQLSTNFEIYQLALVKIYSKNYQSTLTNNFYNSLIKKRIIMLHKNKSKNTNKWKYTLLVPALALFMIAFNTQTIAQNKDSKWEIKTGITEVSLIIDKSSTDKDLNNEKEFFKKEHNIKLTFKGIKRNSKGEITAIKIEVKAPKSNANYSTSSSTPINPIKISYDKDNNSVSINSGKKISKNHYAYKIHKKTGKDGNYVFISSDDKKNKKNNVWIYKTDEKGNKGEKSEKVIVFKNGKKNIKVINDNVIIDDTDTEINTDEDGNVVIIKQTSGKDGKHISHAKTTNFWVSSDNKKPLFIIDGKESSKDQLDKINSETIEKIEVLKGKNAVKKYGDKGENGVILITTKKEK